MCVTAQNIFDKFGIVLSVLLALHLWLIHF